MEKDLTGSIIEALKLMQSRLGVLSTIGEDGSPDSAVIYYTHDDELNLYFMCSKTSLKFKNIIRAPKVSFTIYSEHPPKTVQIKGDAEPLNEADVKLRLQELQGIATKSNALPPIKQIGDVSGVQDVTVVRIKPTWMRLGDFDIYREHNMFQEKI